MRTRFAKRNVFQKERHSPSSAVARCCFPLLSLSISHTAAMPQLYKARDRDMEAPIPEHREQLIKNHQHRFHARTVSRIVTRIQALALELLPMQVDLEEITSPTSSILTKDVVDAFSKIAGDFDHCLPFALLQARRYFAIQQRINPADSDENEGRKLACEALARKIIVRTPRQDQYSILSARFTVIEDDGDESLPLSGPSIIVLATHFSKLIFGPFCFSSRNCSRSTCNLLPLVKRSSEMYLCSLERFARSESCRWKEWVNYRVSTCESEYLSPRH